eukprot:256453_1
MTQPFNTLGLSLVEANRLRIGDEIDHRDDTGRYCRAKIIAKNATKLQINYTFTLCKSKYDKWCDYAQELYRFRKYKSVWRRPAHRLNELKIGDFVDINPAIHKEWKPAEIKCINSQSGQVQVAYEFMDKTYLWWTHLDDTNEIDTFATKSLNNLSNFNKQQIEIVYNKMKLDLEIPQVFSQFKLRKFRMCKKRKFCDINDNKEKSENNINAPQRKKQKLNTIDQSQRNNNKNNIPQWIQCTECRKWRIILVLVENISEWNRPLNWKCIMNNDEFNKCSLPQQTEMHLYRKYSKMQRVALSIQRHYMLISDEENTKLGINNKALQNENDDLKKKIQDIENKMQGNNEKLRKEIERIKNKNSKLIIENAQMIDKLNLYNGNTNMVSTLNLHELDALTLKLQNGMNVINEAKDRLLENKLYCTVCLKNQKNVVILTCGHFDLCNECETNLPAKICPRCDKPYDNMKVINL